MNHFARFQLSSRYVTFHVYLLSFFITVRFTQVLASLSFCQPICPWVLITIIFCHFFTSDASQVAQVVKNLPASAGDLRDVGSIPGSGRSPGGGHGSPLQYSCLENPMDRGAWRATVHGVTKSRTQPKGLSMHVHMNVIKSYNTEDSFILLHNCFGYF